MKYQLPAKLTANIQLSDKTMSLLRNLKQAYGLNYLDALELQPPQKTDLDNILAFLTIEKPMKRSSKLRLMLSKLEVSILDDIANNLKIATTEKNPQKKEKNNIWQRWMFSLFYICGIIFAFCDGLDSALSVFQVLTNATWALVVPCAIISLISVTVFIAFDITETSKKLGVTISEKPNLASNLKDTQERILDIQNHFLGLTRSANTVEELEFLNTQLQILKKMHLRTQKDAKKMLAAYERRDYIVKAQNVISHLCALFYFGTAFYIGQGAALTALGGITMSTAMLNPFTASVVIGLSLICSFAYTVCYYGMVSPDIKSFVSKAFGFDKETLDEVMDEDRIERIEHGFDTSEEILSFYLSTKGSPTTLKKEDLPTVNAAPTPSKEFSSTRQPISGLSYKEALTSRWFKPAPNDVFIAPGETPHNAVWSP